MLKFKNMTFWAPDDEGGAGGVADLLGPAGGEAEPQSEPAMGVDTPEGAPAQSATVDAAELAKQFGSVIGEHFKQTTPKAAEPKLSLEESKKLLRVWEPDDDFVRRFGNLETQKAALAEMRDRLLEQFDTVAQIRLQQQQEAWEARFNPVSALIEQQTAQQREVRFHESYPQLANPALRPLIATVVQQLHQGGKLNGDEGAAFSAIAAGVESVIRATNPEFKLTTGAKAPKTPKPGIPVTTPGTGGGGGGQGGNQAAPSGVPKAVALWPKITAV